MSFGFMITDLQSPEKSFSVSARFGTWEFEKVSWYDKIIPELGKGMTGNTFQAFNDTVTPSISDQNLHAACEDLRDLCLLLSFQNALCVTPSGSSPGSFTQFLGMGELFVPPRAIRGLPTLKLTTTMAPFLTKGLAALSGSQSKYLRLLLFYSINSLTCFTLEDLFLGACVQFDIVKQAERQLFGNPKLTYLQGMQSASSRLGIPVLNQDFKNMRNDLVHEGLLSGSNFPGRTKAQCSSVVADALTWIDQYVVAACGAGPEVDPSPRWNAPMLEHSVPAFSLA